MYAIGAYCAFRREACAVGTIPAGIPRLPWGAGIALGMALGSPDRRGERGWPCGAGIAVGTGDGPGKRGWPCGAGMALGIGAGPAGRELRALRRHRGGGSCSRPSRQG